jgi:hypothetical protein
VLYAPIIRQIRGYDATEWEIFPREWVKGLDGYHDVKRLGGPGDHGRDVICLYSKDGCACTWDNYQCKNYEGMFRTPAACEDAGKIIFHGFRKMFTPPRRYMFVAPRGPSTDLRDKLLNPDRFKDEVITTWDTRVARNVVDGEHHPLTGDLADYVDRYDFTSFNYITLDDVVDLHRRTAYWNERFGGLLPPPRRGVTPAVVTPHETVYVEKLLQVYAEAASSEIKTVSDLDAHDEWRRDLLHQRVRFFDAEAFIATYRDQTEPGTTESFADEIFDAIEPLQRVPGTGLDRLIGALTVAGQAYPASVLTPQAKIGVKQGVCHQLANDDRVTWKI